jgi:hypothetical protein
MELPDGMGLTILETIRGAGLPTRVVVSSATRDASLIAAFTVRVLVRAHFRQDRLLCCHRDSASDLGITRFHTLATPNLAKNQGKTALCSIETELFDGLYGHLRNPCVTLSPGYFPMTARNCRTASNQREVTKKAPAVRSTHGGADIADRALPVTSNASHLLTVTGPRRS